MCSRMSGCARQMSPPVQHSESKPVQCSCLLGLHVLLKAHLQLDMLLSASVSLALRTRRSDPIMCLTGLRQLSETGFSVHAFNRCVYTNEQVTRPHVRGHA